jgi:pimeloyl-ACP methyl ester carboxylesterase
VRDVPGRQVAVNGRSVYVEESGHGSAWVVFEAGAGCGRTSWDLVLPLLADKAHLVTYDRAGRGLSGPATGQLTVDDLAADLAAMTEAVVPGEFVLIAHSMGGLVARAAADRLGHRMRGLLLADVLPETSPVYDTWDQTTKKVDRMLAVTQVITRSRLGAGLVASKLRHLYGDDTYQTMLVEDFTPAGTRQTRREMKTVAAAIPQFRAQPPHVPTCPTIVLSVSRAAKGRERQQASLRDHQRRYAETLRAARYEVVDSAHLIQAERPELLADRIDQLLLSCPQAD